MVIDVIKLLLIADFTHNCHEWAVGVPRNLKVVFTFTPSFILQPFKYL